MKMKSISVIDARCLMALYLTFPLHDKDQENCKIKSIYFEQSGVGWSMYAQPANEADEPVLLYRGVIPKQEEIPFEQIV